MTSETFEVYASVSPRSVGPNSLFTPEIAIQESNVKEFASDKTDIRDSKRALTKAGFHVFEQGSSDITISISGSAKLFKEFFGAKLARQKAEVQPGVVAEYMGTADEDALLSPPEELANLIEGVVIARPPTYFGSAIPPIAAIAAGAYQYLRVPDDVAVVLRAARVHRLGVTGKDILVGMPDTGFYAHPFFSQHGYRYQTALLAPGATDAAQDNVGHGTGESANIFACAPDCRLLPIKMGNDAVGAINTAMNASPRPRIVTNSWGYDVDTGGSIPSWLKPLEAAIANAVASGVVVCFSAGNGHRAFPASHPDVIAVGGVHVNLPNINDFEASSYASSFNSSFYPGRAVPDVCGLTGKKVTLAGQDYAPSLLLPVQDGADLDNITPATSPGNDGWGLFSGTSAASPQIAGIVALMLEKNPDLTPAQVKAKLKSSGRDVTKGKTRMGDAAGVGPDLATGAGLADAKWAYINTMGEVAAAFFAAPRETQLAMVESGRMPDVTTAFIEDLIETLRSR